jgi:transcriptional regulator with XRE-family HTH domain
MVAARLVGYRSDNDLSQRALAGLLGVSQPRVVELESGEKNPQVETLVKIAAATGLEFAIDIVPVGQVPRLVARRSRADVRTSSPAPQSWLPPVSRVRYLPLQRGCR